MSDKQPEQTDPLAAAAANGADAAVSAMGAAMTNRDAILKSLAERRDEVFKMLEAQREEALKPMLDAKELLRQAQVSAGLAAQSGSAFKRHDSSSENEPKSADSRQRLSRALNKGLTVFLALQGAGGAAADAARNQAALEVADTLAELIEKEVEKLLHC
jgi:hypothetical protein